MSKQLASTWLVLASLTATACTEADGPALGWQLGDGSEGSASVEPIYEPELPVHATDLAFHPDREGELWIVHRFDPPTEPCNEEDTNIDACQQLVGSVAIMADGTSPMSAAERKSDTNAWHFMRQPPAMAFGANGTFGTCGEWRTGNFDDGAADFIGPTLFSSDLSIFSVDPGDGLNGSHLDMLHASPWCVGIAHERDNVYWVFNGDRGTLDRYDFHRDHGIGQADHSDGEIWHHVVDGLQRVPFVPSHLAYDPLQRRLFVADTAGGRILRVDPSAGAITGDYEPNYDELAVNVVVEGATVETFVGPDELDQPSGIVVTPTVIFVGDHATSRLLAFDREGELLVAFDTGLPPGTLAGLALGPDGLLYFADLATGRAYRVVPQSIP